MLNESCTLATQNLLGARDVEGIMTKPYFNASHALTRHFRDQLEPCRVRNGFYSTMIRPFVVFELWDEISEDVSARYKLRFSII